MTQQIQAAAMQPLFNPLAPEFIRNPYPAYHWLREADPVHRSPLGLVVATRHADVALVMRDPLWHDRVIRSPPAYL